MEAEQQRENSGTPAEKAGEKPEGWPTPARPNATQEKGLLAALHGAALALGVGLQPQGTEALQLADGMAFALGRLARTPRTVQALAARALLHLPTAAPAGKGDA